MTYTRVAPVQSVPYPVILPGHHLPAPPSPWPKGLGMLQEGDEKTFEYFRLKNSTPGVFIGGGGW